MARPCTYRWQHAAWPQLTYDADRASAAMASARRAQGELEGRAAAIGLDRDGDFLGGLNADKYMKLTGVSKATATRDLGELVGRGLLWTDGQGKALRYSIEEPGWTHHLPARQVA